MSIRTRFTIFKSSQRPLPLSNRTRASGSPEREFTMAAGSRDKRSIAQGGSAREIALAPFSEIETRDRVALV